MVSADVDTSAAKVPAIERTITLKALDRTLRLEAVSGSGAGARVMATERDAAGKVLALADVLAGEIAVAADNGYALRAGGSSFSLTPKGAARVQAWLLQLRGAAVRVDI
jgi:hypothetical protein